MGLPRLSRRWRYHDETPTQQDVRVRRGIPAVQFAAAVVPNGPQPTQGSDEVRRLALDYVAGNGQAYGLPHYQITPRRRLDPRLSVATADAFDAMPHDPGNPAVRASYDALLKETVAQYNHLTQNGYKIEPWLQAGQPYANSKEMIRDVQGKHIWFFPTVNEHEKASFGEGTGDLDPTMNPGVAKTGHVVNGHELRFMDLFRAVHDVYGHAKDGYEFGPEGEYNAWASHAKMYSPLAQKALATETHGQNSWVNFGRHLRRPDGTVPAKGEPDYVHPQARPYAQQKVGILPDHVTPPHPYLPNKPAAPASPAAPQQLRRLGKKIRLSRVRRQNDPLTGDVTGFITHFCTRPKSDEDAWAGNKETFDREFTKRMGRLRDAPQQLHMPRVLGGTSMASSYAKPDDLPHQLVAQMLHEDDHEKFLTYADQAARRHLGLSKYGPQDHFTHLHGAGSWENTVEPSTTTVFHKPITATQLHHLGADIGAWARQLATLVYLPHPDGREKMLHARLRTHDPVRGTIPPQLFADISSRVHHEFNKYTFVNDKGKTEFQMPGRSILPGPDGMTDVLVWLSEWDKNPVRTLGSFTRVADAVDPNASRTGGLRFWPGSGVLLGGTDPHTEDEVESMSDQQKRDAAKTNYANTMKSVAEIHDPVPTEPRQLSRRDWVVQFARQALKLAGLSPDARGILDGWLEHPQDTFRGNILGDALLESGHPAGDWWSWYMNHAQPLVAGVTPATESRYNILRPHVRDGEIISRHVPEEVVATQRKSFYPGTSDAMPFVSGALIRNLQGHNPITGGTLPPLLTRLSTRFPKMADAFHRFIAAKELGGAGIIPAAESQQIQTDARAHAHTLDVADPPSPSGLNFPHGMATGRVGTMFDTSERPAWGGYTNHSAIIREYDPDIMQARADAGETRANIRDPSNIHDFENRTNQDVTSAMSRMRASVQKHFKDRTQLARSPAGTGIVVRGVFYPPGKMIPTLEPEPAAPVQAAAQPVKTPSVLDRLREAAKRRQKVPVA